MLNRALAKDPAAALPNGDGVSGKALQVALAQKSAAGDAVAPLLPNPTPAGGRVSQGPAPQWPGAKRERQPTQPGLGRVWLALLAAVVLLVGIVGVGGYIVQQQQTQQHATQTQTAQQAQRERSCDSGGAADHDGAADRRRQSADADPSPSTTPVALGQRHHPTSATIWYRREHYPDFGPIAICGGGADDAVVIE